MSLRIQSGARTADQQPHKNASREGWKTGGGGKRAYHERARAKSEARCGVHKEGARFARCGRREGEGERETPASQVRR